ncbi:hypothetical protein PBY51_008524 [Eleginops maclovinus]|uniref:N-acyl-phosphatidylethanolamine-hydrolyzing phospholipase D n=1 Tax=Eleginops maclovinus TaxID=56733 RepID=A0AAN8A1R4_ELEMC|nr:hypothetical protein PBY51_008524 [Eleginops maclovinus]
MYQPVKRLWTMSSPCWNRTLSRTRTSLSLAPGLRVTWLGHATVLVEMDGLISSQTQYSARGPPPSNSWVPKGTEGPPCTVEQLPRIDAVVISHSHYDHLDAGSVASLNAPLRRGATLVRAPGFDGLAGEDRLKRTALDDNKSLWGSWSILGPDHRFFFAGDTGYCASFQEIGRRFGPFDLAAIPIGAYLPRDMMQGQHVNPEEAVQVHQDLQAKQSVAIHWGTFALAYEYYLEPPVRLREVLEQKGLMPESFFTLHHGESRLISSQEDVFD